MLFIRTVRVLFIAILAFIMNGAVSCQRQQRGKMTVTQPKFCVEDGGLLEIVFLAIKVTFVGYQFLTDFDSRNLCLCSRRSHGPLLCAFCLCFTFTWATFCVELYLKLICKHVYAKVVQYML